MNRQAWVIAHDQSLDHRLFFFTRYFEEQGFSSKLIASKYQPSQLYGFDPAFVLRPENKIVLHTLGEGRKFDFSLHDPLVSFFMLEAMQVVSEIAHEQVSRTPKLNRSEVYEILHKRLGSVWISTATSGERIAFCFEILGTSKSLSFDSETGEFSLHTQLVPRDLQNQKFSQLCRPDYPQEVFDFRPMDVKIAEALQTGELEAPAVICVADLPTLPLAIYYKEKFNCPLILDCHEWWYEQHLVWGMKNDQKAAMYDQYERDFYPKADLLLTGGRELAQDMTRHFGVTFECIYTCDSSKKAPAFDKKEFWSQKLNDYQGERILLFQGNLTHQRNLDFMARLTAYLPKDVLLVVAGDGSYRDQFLSLVHNEGNSQRLRHIGWQPQERLLEFTNAADLGLIPYVPVSRYYATGAPNKLFEFMASHLPIVHDPAMLEVLNIVSGNGFGASVGMSDPKSAGGLIAKYIRDEAWLKGCRAQYQERASFFSYQGQVEVFDSLVRSAIPDLLSPFPQTNVSDAEKMELR